ncbi:MAG: hypothetical protein AAGC93_22990 [Cyanobacteria bacterium P01_F01_bin.53]
MSKLNLRILVAGGYDSQDEAALDRPIEEIKAFVTELGKQIVEQGHILLNGCQTEVDRIIAESAFNHLSGQDNFELEVGKRIRCYVREKQKPIHQFGTIMESDLENWDLGGRTPTPPEIIGYADVVILIGGFRGTFKAANWARLQGTPILAFSTFGGTSEEVHEEELQHFDQMHAEKISRDEYDAVLKSLSTNWPDLAVKTVELAEKVVTNRDVFVVMSFNPLPEYKDLYASLKSICKEFDYDAQRVDESNLHNRIIPEITKQVRQCAFVIADVSEPSPNVFYELGFADGFGKEVILVAKKDTELPFDIGDAPVIFWESFEQFKVDLRKRVQDIARGHGRSHICR